MCLPVFCSVIPAKAGIQFLDRFYHEKVWTPAFAGVTKAIESLVTG